MRNQMLSFNLTSHIYLRRYILISRRCYQSQKFQISLILCAIWTPSICRNYTSGGDGVGGWIGQTAIVKKYG